MADAASPEKGTSLESAVEQKANLIVSQPQKLEGLLETIALIDKVSERMGEDKSSDLGASGGAAATGQKKGDQSQQSIRKLAIANLPEPRIMQRQLEKYINREVNRLHKKVVKLTKASKPGQAHKINDIYAKIRRLNSLLAEMVEASYEIIKRLYIRIFVDKQSIL